MRSVIALCAVLAVTSCGAADEFTRPDRGKKKKSEPKPVPAEIEEDAGERPLAEPAPEAPRDEESKAEPAPRKPLPGWVDEGTGYRFFLLEDPAAFTVADVESEDFATFLDLTPSERQDVAAAKLESEDSAVKTVAILFPEVGVYLELARAIVRGLESFGASLDGPGRRKSLCERKLGDGWHYPSEQLVKDADEDDVRKNVKELEGKSVWLAGRLGASKHSYTFVQDAAGTRQWVLDDPKLASLCVTRAH